MQQYLDLLRTIKEKGTHKPAARAGMPGSTSLFGHQMRFNLQDGFPAITTKKLYWKGVVVELLWFLRGDTNIKYLIDNGCNIWNEDAYNYYKKVVKLKTPIELHYSFEEFISTIKASPSFEMLKKQFGEGDYILGDCGFQYGKVWRNWVGKYEEDWGGTFTSGLVSVPTDQITNLIKSLKKTPESRRHLVTAIDPAHDQDLALYWCHALFQFNCRPLTYEQRMEIFMDKYVYNSDTPHVNDPDPANCAKYGFTHQENLDYNLTENYGIPKYYLDCQLYQRSADVFLGVPFNIASYALLTHILAKICNMVPGEFVHTFGDVHIYDNHMDAVNEQLTREPLALPELKLNPVFDWSDLDKLIKQIEHSDLTQVFQLWDYDSHRAIKAELSTGLIK